MTRLGMNPARKQSSDFQPAQVTVAIVTYIPHLEGYFRHRLDVLKLSLTSLLKHTQSPFDLLILDNGSCPEVRNYLTQLHRQGEIDYLLWSKRNLGVMGALQLLSRTALGKYLAYANDDVFYYPGWLSEHLKIMETYPKVGMVSGSPVGISSEQADQSFWSFVDQDLPGVNVSQRERIMAWEREWARSTGRDEEQHLEEIRSDRQDVVFYQGVKAVNSAAHFQFLAPRGVLRRALPEQWRSELMGGVVEMDYDIDALGYMRLSTPERLTRHIGNMIDEDLLEEAKRLGLDLTHKTAKKGGRHWILRIPGSGRLLSSVYHWLFKILNRVE